jgi:O-antigen ligase
VSVASEAITVPITTVAPGSPSRRAVVGGSIALLCVFAVLLEATADLLPDDPITGVITPVRLVLGVGLVAATVAGVGPRQWRTPLDLPILGLLLATAAATVAAGQPWAGWRGVLTAVAAYYLVVGVRRAMPGSDAAHGLLALVAVGIAATTAVRQIANNTATGWCRGALDGSADVCEPGTAVRAIGTFSNPNLLAAFLVLLLPVAAAGSVALADRASRLLGTAVVVLGYAAVLMTASRGGIIAAVAGAVAFVALRGPNRRMRIGLVVGSGAVVAGLLLLLVTGASVGVRADVWTTAARLVVSNPLGVGPGRAGALLDAAITGDEPFQHAHNMWLNWAVETGVPGLAAMLAITVGAAALAVRAARGGSVLAAAVGAGLAGFAVISLADHPANAIRISLALWAVLALVVNWTQGAATRTVGEPATTAIAAVSRRPRRGRGQAPDR